MTTINGLSGSTYSTGGASGSGSPGGAILSSAGIGSGLDVNSIVTALVNAKKSGPQAQITNQQTQDSAVLAGLTSLQSGLTSLQASLSKLTYTGTFQSFSATLANSTIGSATTLSNAQPGNYALVVNSLATAQKRASGVYGATTAVGDGTLTLAVGSNSVDVAVSTTDTLSDIAAKINAVSGNPGVQATVVNGASGAQLLLSSTKTGVANGFAVTASATSSGGLANLATQLSTPGSNEAKDASLSLDGIAITSASNSVSGAINGVTINLSAAGSTTLTVSRDNSAATNAVQAFVDAYNSYQKTVGTLASYDPSTKQAGVLLGDATLSSLQRQIASVLSSKVAGNSFGSMAVLGVTRQADGSLALDSSKLTAALNSNPAAVQDLFAGTNGYATRLNSALDGFTTAGGVIPTRQQSLNDALTKLTTQQTQLDQRMSVYQQQLLSQYNALDTLMSQLNNTSSYLTSQLSALEATYTKSGK